MNVGLSGLALQTNRTTCPVLILHTVGKFYTKNVSVWHAIFFILAAIIAAVSELRSSGLILWDISS